MPLDQEDLSHPGIDNKRRVEKMERLDVEGEEERQRRLQRVFLKLNAESSSSNLVLSRPQVSLPGLRAEPIEPPHDLLARVKAFLPQMEAANALLANKDPDSLDIENLSVDQAQFIEMNLGLGVFEDVSNRDTDADMQGTSSSSSSSESSDEESDYSTDQSSEIITCFNSGPRPIRPLPRRSLTRPQIVVLEDEKTDHSSSSAP